MLDYSRPKEFITICGIFKFKDYLKDFHLPVFHVKCNAVILLQIRKIGERLSIRSQANVYSRHKPK